MLKKVHIIGLGLMGTNLGIKLVNSGIKVSGSDISEKNVGRAKELGALSLDHNCLLYTSPSPRDVNRSRMPSSA